MSDVVSPDRIKDFLDDLARISLRHGLKIGATYDGGAVQEIDEFFDGYSTDVEEAHDGHGLRLADMRFHGPNVIGAYHNSIDITQLSNHERLAVIGNRSPDLARMLREAFLAGSYGDEDWCEETSHAFEREAAKYAEKIMGGHGFEDTEALQQEAEFIDKHGVPGARLLLDDGGQS